MIDILNEIFDLGLVWTAVMLMGAVEGLDMDPLTTVRIVMAVSIVMVIRRYYNGKT